MTADSAAAQHVTRTLQALELLAEAPQTQADIARQLDVHRRTARRLLGRMIDEGFVRPVSHGPHTAYEPTARLVVLGRKVAERLDLAAIASAHLGSASTVGVESWYVAFTDMPGFWLGNAPKSNADKSARTRQPALRRELLHAQAEGKVFLSADTTLLNEVLNQGLLPFTDATITTRADLLLDLATIRARGYATEAYEHDPEARAVASGVRDHTDRTIATVGAILSPGGEPDEIGARLRAVAHAMTIDIGGTVPPPNER
jgi:IclR family acetate operon transcriptional repressor